MKAIVTSFYGPTEFLPPRVIARDCDGNRFVLKYGAFRDGEDPHETAAYGLLNKMGWNGQLVGGGIKGGMAWCFLPIEKVQPCGI